jgi:hypothetical protein
LKEIRSHSGCDKVMLPLDATHHHAIRRGTGNTLYQPKLVHLSQRYLRCEMLVSDIQLSIAPQLTDLEHSRGQNLQIDISNPNAFGNQFVNNRACRVAVSIQ